VGKTSLAAALAKAARATVLPELDATGAPPPAEAEPWFTQRHAAKWRRALDAAESAPLVVMDGDSWKGLWYNWLHADEGWPGVDVVSELCAMGLQEGRLAPADVYVILEADVDALRARRHADPTRLRRNQERHLERLPAFAAYITEFARLWGDRVVRLPTVDRESLVPRVLEAVARAPAEPPTLRECEDLLGALSSWLRRNTPPRSAHVLPP
jgi:hypothetical protein